MKQIQVYDEHAKRSIGLAPETPMLMVPHNMGDSHRAWVVDDASLYYLPDGQKFETTERSLVPSDWGHLSDARVGESVLAKVNEGYQQAIDSSESVKVGVYHLVTMEQR